MPLYPFQGLPTVRKRIDVDLAEALEAILNEVKSRNIRIASQGRLFRYLEVLRSRGTERVDEVSSAHHEVEEIVTAVEHLTKAPEVTGWAPMFRDIQCGPVVPAMRHDRAREKQTELVMGGLMRSTGAAVSFEEPDAKAIVEGNVLSFAAKRLTSPNNLLKNVRDGRNQLARAGGVGVLFMDMTPLVTALGQAHLVPSIEMATASFDQILDESLRTYVTPVVRWLQAEPARAGTIVALVSVLNVRVFVPAAGSERNHFGTLRRIHGDATSPDHVVPEWLFHFLLRFNRMGVPSS